MNNINIVIIEGVVVDEPTPIPNTKSGMKFAIKNVRKSGEYTFTSFFKCSAFGRAGETVQKYVTKGKNIVIQGNIKITKKDEKYYTDISINDLYFKDDGSLHSIGEEVHDAPPIDARVQDIFPDDIPF